MTVTTMPATGAGAADGAEPAKQGGKNQVSTA